MRTAEPKVTDQTSDTAPARWAEFVRELFWVVMPLVGLALYLLCNTHESLWLDEVYSLAASNPAFSPADIWRLTATDVHPPLYFELLWLVRTVAGPSIFVARVFSALGACILLWLGAGPLRRALGDKVAQIFLLLTLLCPAILAYAQDVRMYTWTAAAVLGMVVHIFLAVRDGRRSDWVKTGLFMCAAMYLHMYGLMAAFWTAIFCLVYTAGWRRDRLMPCLIVLGAAGVAFLPWCLVLAGQVDRVNAGFWIPPVSRKGILAFLVYPFGFKFHAPMRAVWTFALVCASALFGCFAARREAGATRFSGLCLGVYGATFGGALLVSVIAQPILVARYALSLVGLLLTLAAVGLARLRAPVRVVVLIAIIALEFPMLREVVRQRFNGPMREVAAYLEPQLRSGDFILHTDPQTLGTFAWYLPACTQVVYDPKSQWKATDLPPLPNVVVVTNLADLHIRTRGCWLASRPCAPPLMPLEEEWHRAYLDTANYFGFTAPRAKIVKGQPYANAAMEFTLPRSWYTVVLERIPAVDAIRVER